MYTQIGVIGSSSELRLDASVFSGCEAAAADHMPTLADDEATHSSFWTRATELLSNKQATLWTRGRQGGFEALLPAAVESKTMSLSRIAPG